MYLMKQLEVLTLAVLHTRIWLWAKSPARGEFSAAPGTDRREGKVRPVAARNRGLMIGVDDPTVPTMRMVFHAVARLAKASDG